MNWRICACWWNVFTVEWLMYSCFILILHLVRFLSAYWRKIARVFTASFDVLKPIAKSQRNSLRALPFLLNAGPTYILITSSGFAFILVLYWGRLEAQNNSVTTLHQSHRAPKACNMAPNTWTGDDTDAADIDAGPPSPLFTWQADCRCLGSWI